MIIRALNVLTLLTYMFVRNYHAALSKEPRRSTKNILVHESVYVYIT